MEIVYKINHQRNFFKEIDIAHNLNFKTIEIEFTGSIDRYDLDSISKKLQNFKMQSILHIPLFLTHVFKYSLIEQASIKEVINAMIYTKN